jgi:hypothetical protein
VLNSPVEGVCGGLPVTCKEDILKASLGQTDCALLSCPPSVTVEC